MIFGYMYRRFLYSLILVFVVTLASFSFIFLSGDPTVLLIGEIENLNQTDIEDIRHQAGLDRPIIIQYLGWLSSVMQGDFGMSLYHRESNFKLILERIPATLELALVSISFSLIIALPLGIIAALKHNTLIDRVIMVLVIIGQSIPSFWLSIVLIFTFGVHLRWLPVSGRGTWQQLIIPVVSVALSIIARHTDIIRFSMLEVINSDYVRTARAKGLSSYYIILNHSLRNALIPSVTVVGIDLADLLTGIVVVEKILAWPGVGRLVLQAVTTKDFPLVQACVIFLAIVFVSINLIVDLIYLYLDPRISSSTDRYV